MTGDTLTASSTGPDSFSLSEGDDLTLQCLISSNTFQHTHLSVTWYLYGDGEASPRSIISLDRDLTVSLGQGFEGLYQAGLIGLDKLEEATYRLKMARIELSDTGRIYCHAQEWIQDPDRSWYPISHKDAQATTLEVKAIGEKHLSVFLLPILSLSPNCVYTSINYLGDCSGL